MKKINIIISFLFVFQFAITCCTNKKYENKSLENEGLNSYLKEKNVKLLDDCLINFDIYLNENYKYIAKEKRIKEFLNNYYQISISDNQDTLQFFIMSFNFCLENVKLLESNGFFTTNINKRNESVIYKSQKWRLKNLFDENKNNIDLLIRNDSLKSFRFSNNRVGTDFYYGLNELAKEKKDTFTQNWIEAKIVTHDTRGSVAYTKTLTNEYLNSVLCKTMIIVEFVLPYYNFDKEKFEMKKAK